jgi:hypothetical protein
MDTVNSLRLQWGSSKEAQAVHARAFPLQYTLSSLNNNQGLGYRVLGKVIDKRTLNVIFISAVSFFSTALPLLIANMPTHLGGGQCNITALDADLVRAVFARTSCPTNTTIASVTAL